MPRKFGKSYWGVSLPAVVKRRSRHKRGRSKAEIPHIGALWLRQMVPGLILSKIIQWN